MTDGVVTAVVVRWRGGNEVDRCLRSLLSRGRPEVGRIVLVDSGSSDGGGERLARTYSDVETILLPENRSFAVAASTGVDRGSEPLLLLLNPDTEIDAGALTPLVRYLDENTEIAGAVPLLMNSDGTHQHQWQLRQLPGSQRLALGLPGKSQFGNPPETPCAVEQPAASAWLVRRSVWEALGGLDSRFAPAWWEDVDFCARLAGAAGTTGFPASKGFHVVPASHILHGGGSSLANLSDETFLITYYRNLLRYAERHHRSRIAFIRRGLAVSLRFRAATRPSRRPAYLATIRALGSA